MKKLILGGRGRELTLGSRKRVFWAGEISTQKNARQRGDSETEGSKSQRVIWYGLFIGAVGIGVSII